MPVAYPFLRVEEGTKKEAEEFPNDEGIIANTFITRSLQQAEKSADCKNEHTEGEASPNGNRKILSDLERCAKGYDSRSIDEASDHPEKKPYEDNVEGGRREL